MTSETPDIESLTRLMAESFDRLPPPDENRLAAIETRLLERRADAPRPKRTAPAYGWWIALLAGAGTAAASWWVFDYVSKQGPAPAALIETKPERPATTGAPTEPRDKRAASEAASPRPESAPKRGPIIYQREGSK